jgi:hypothetical protein
MGPARTEGRKMEAEEIGSKSKIPSMKPLRHVVFPADPRRKDEGHHAVGLGFGIRFILLNGAHGLAHCPKETSRFSSSASIFLR